MPGRAEDACGLETWSRVPEETDVKEEVASLGQWAWFRLLREVNKTSSFLGQVLSRWKNTTKEPANGESTLFVTDTGHVGRGHLDGGVKMVLLLPWY